MPRRQAALSYVVLCICVNVAQGSVGPPLVVKDGTDGGFFRFGYRPEGRAVLVISRLADSNKLLSSLLSSLFITVV
jgi:hypothetical protein